MNNRISNRNRAQLPIIGRVKIGMKDEQKGYPKSLDYFVSGGKFKQNFDLQYGEKPNKILIFFASQDAITQQYELYVGSKRMGVSDGLTVNYAHEGEFKSETFDTFEEASDFMNEYLESLKVTGKNKPEWKLSLKMNFLLAEMRDFWGLWQFSTKGAASMVNQIANTFDNTLDMFGRIVGIPFWITVEKVNHTSALDGQKKIFPVVSISPAIGIPQLMQLEDNSSTAIDLINNCTKMLNIADKTPLKAIEQPKSISEKTIESIHTKIENGEGTVQSAIEYYKNNEYLFDESVFTTPRLEYLDVLCDSIDNIDDIISVLKGKGYILNDKMTQKLSASVVSKGN